jgi:hypothetical protein
MKNKVAISVAIGLLTVAMAGGGYYVYTKNSKSSTPATEEGGFAEMITDKVKEKAVEVVSPDGVYCTYDENDTKFYVDIKNEKMKIVGEYIEDGEKVDTVNLLLTDGYMYMWQDINRTMSMKMPVDTADGYSDSYGELLDLYKDPKKVEELLNEDANANYKCKAWNPTADVFEIPDDITFTDYEDEINQLKENLQSQCDSLTGTAKTQCLESFDAF